MQRSKIQRELALSVQPSVDAAEGDGKAVSPTSQIYFAYSLICPDEQRLTMQAYKKPVLIEDVVRNAATILKADGRLGSRSTPRNRKAITITLPSRKPSIRKQKGGT